MNFPSLRSLLSYIFLIIAATMASGGDVARAFVASGFAAVRFNFRGIGSSKGAWDEGRGEIDDALAVDARLAGGAGRVGEHGVRDHLRDRRVHGPCQRFGVAYPARSDTRWRRRSEDDLLGERRNRAHGSTDQSRDF